MADAARKEAPQEIPESPQSWQPEGATLQEAEQESFERGREKLGGRKTELDSDVESASASFKESTSGWWRRIKAAFSRAKDQAKGDEELRSFEERAESYKEEYRRKADEAVSEAPKPQEAERGQAQESPVIDLEAYRVKRKAEGASPEGDSAAPMKVKKLFEDAEAAAREEGAAAEQEAPSGEPSEPEEEEPLPQTVAELSKEYDRLAAIVAAEGAAEQAFQKKVLKDKMNLPPITGAGERLNKVFAELNRLRAGGAPRVQEAKATAPDETKPTPEAESEKKAPESPEEEAAKKPESREDEGAFGKLKELANDIDGLDSSWKAGGEKKFLDLAHADRAAAQRELESWTLGRSFISKEEGFQQRLKRRYGFSEEDIKTVGASRLEAQRARWISAYDRMIAVGRVALQEQEKAEGPKGEKKPEEKEKSLEEQGLEVLRTLTEELDAYDPEAGKKALKELLQADAEAAAQELETWKWKRAFTQDEAGFRQMLAKEYRVSDEAIATIGSAELEAQRLRMASMIDGLMAVGAEHPEQQQQQQQQQEEEEEEEEKKETAEDRGAAVLRALRMRHEGFESDPERRMKSYAEYFRKQPKMMLGEFRFLQWQYASTLDEKSFRGRLAKVYNVSEEVLGTIDRIELEDARMRENALLSAMIETMWREMKKHVDVKEPAAGEEKNGAAGGRPDTAKEKKARARKPKAAAGGEVIDMVEVSPGVFKAPTEAENEGLPESRSPEPASAEAPQAQETASTPEDSASQETPEAQSQEAATAEAAPAQETSVKPADKLLTAFNAVSATLSEQAKKSDTPKTYASKTLGKMPAAEFIALFAEEGRMTPDDVATLSEEFKADPEGFETLRKRMVTAVNKLGRA